MDDQGPIDLGIDGLENPVEVGVGGFATVYRAEQPAFRRTVAVKVLSNPNLGDADRERFERECQAMGSLSEHPNIVTVYGAGFTNSRRPYLVMAFLGAGSLQDRLDRTGPISWQDATLYGVHLAGALETAHQADVIHRDIKPGNVLMSSYGDAQLTDFGIARISGGHETRSGVITASMAHAPPEVLDGQKPTMSGDVYSLASTIYELMLGTPPFEMEGDESMVPMLRRILTEAPPDLRPDGVPDEICAVLERAMAKDPGDRPQSAAQFGRELQAARRALGIDPGKLTVPEGTAAEGDDVDLISTPVVPADRRTGTIGTATTSIGAGEAGVGEKKKGRGVLVAAIVLVVLVVGGVAAAFLLRDSSSPTTQTAAGGTTTTTAPTDYRPVDERLFVKGCEDRGEPLSTCRCIFAGIKAEISYDRFKELNQQASSGGADTTSKDPVLRKIVLDCRAKAEGGQTPPSSN